jgi:hypothetical protein
MLVPIWTSSIFLKVPLVQAHKTSTRYECYYFCLKTLLVTMNNNYKQKWLTNKFKLALVGLGVHHLLKNLNHIIMWWELMILIISKKSLIKLYFKMVLQFCIDHMGFEFTSFPSLNQEFWFVYMNLIPFTIFYL